MKKLRRSGDHGQNDWHYNSAFVEGIEVGFEEGHPNDLLEHQYGQGEEHELSLTPRSNCRDRLEASGKQDSFESFITDLENVAKGTETESVPEEETNTGPAHQLWEAARLEQITHEGDFGVRIGGYGLSWTGI